MAPERANISAHADPEQRLQLGQRVVGVADLDRRHAHRPRRLQVHAEVVEEHDLLSAGAEGAEHEVVGGRVGLAHADLRRLDDDVEQLVEAEPGGALVHGDDVVREQRGAEAVLPAAAHGAEHAGTQVAAEQLQHLAAVDPMAEGRRLLGERVGEGVDVDLAALQAGPRVRVGVGGVDPAQEPVGEPALGLVAGERVERRCRQHATEVPEDR
jgi:hypothetical protein